MKQFRCVSFDGSEFNNTSSISVATVAHSFTLLHDTCCVCDDGTVGVLRKLFGPMSQCASHATGDVDVFFVCPAIRRMVFRNSLVVGRCLCWIPRAPQQIFLGGNRVNTALVNSRRRVTAVCGQMSNTCRSLNDADIVVRRDHACCHDMVLHVAVQGPSCSHSS